KEGFNFSGDVYRASHPRRKFVRGLVRRTFVGGLSDGWQSSRYCKPLDRFAVAHSLVRPPRVFLQPNVLRRGVQAPVVHNRLCQPIGKELPLPTRKGINWTTRICEIARELPSVTRQPRIAK